MGTTTRGFPYPEGTDFVASGDDAIEALAQAIDADLTNRLWASAYGEGPTSAGADTNWSLVYGSADASGFTVVGGASPGFTYTGPAGRWFMLSAGVTISGSSGAANIGLALVANGSTTLWAPQPGGSGRIDVCVPVQLTPGGYLGAYINISGAGGSYQAAHLKAVEM